MIPTHAAEPLRLVSDPQFMADPFATYRTWRESAGIRPALTPDGRPAWLITRFALAQQVLRDPALSVDKRHARHGYQGFALPPQLDANLLNMDGTTHQRLRRLVATGVLPELVERMRTRTTADARQLVAALAGQDGPVDLVEHYAAALPMLAIGRLLGIPVGDIARFRQWTSALITPGAVNTLSPADAVTAMVDYLTDLVEDRRHRDGAGPASDLLQSWVAARDERGQLSTVELVSTVFLTIWTGYEASADLLGAAILELLHRPEHLRALRSDWTGAPAAVDELIRFISPVPIAIRRFAVLDMVLDDVLVHAGDTVLVCLASANRDPRRFARPDELWFGRPDVQGHLGFGHGAHLCLGRHLARLETEIGLRELFTHPLTLGGRLRLRSVQWRPSWRSRGLRRLMVTYDG